MKFPINADTWIDQSRVGAAHGQAGGLVMSDASNKRYALAHVMIPNLAGATVQSATLHVFLRGSAWVAGNVIQVDLLTNRFQEDETWHTYNPLLPSLPGPDQATQSVGGSPADKDHVQIDVTALLANAAAATRFFGLLLSVAAADNRSLYSSEAQNRTLRPYITLTYGKASDAPTHLRPSQGTSVSKPKLSWHSTDQTAYHVQISTTQDGTSPDDDSGMVMDTDTQADSSDTGIFAAFAGVANGASTSWRVRIWNDAGAPTDWSEWVEFTRHNLGNLAITYPVSDGDSVDATTPEIDWTFSGTQNKFELILEPEGFDTGVRASGALTFEIPKGKIKKKVEDQSVEVRVWDQYDRDAPGEPQYVSAVRTFSYTPGGVPAPVDDLTYSVEGPGVVLQWHRASDPDAFVIRQGNDVLVDGLIPDDVVALGGGYYQFKLYRAQANNVTTFTVNARDDATGDSADVSVEVTIRPRGMWLVHEPTRTEVQILGRYNVDMTIAEDGATFLPLGRRAPVRVVENIRGFEGTAGGTVDLDELGDLAFVKSIPPGSFLEDGQGAIRLIFGSQNFSVDLGVLTVSEWPVADSDRRFEVTFEFVQIARPWPVP